MNFYFDENLPKVVAKALDVIETHDGLNRVYSTEIVWGKGIKDIPLIKKLKEYGGILVTHDLKMKTRAKEHQVIRDEGITVFLISLPSGCNFNLIYQSVIKRWETIKEACNKEKHPFVCRIKMNGNYEIV